MSSTPTSGMTSATLLPLVYACSGCSSVAQLANDCAIRLDREGMAQMSCISGVGGGVTSLVRLAQSGRPILALDGCALACVQACLQQAGVVADQHLVLNREGASKRFHNDATDSEVAQVWEVVLLGLQKLQKA
ncbi:putative zinc-binding protein [Undibacterium sp. SXout7W]|uniref:putative zinc-binding protein n=1 Tax=Undibacterium sp. SXout7W TaxID=3413049 RepID=UPI003BEFF3D4